MSNKKITENGNTYYITSFNGKVFYYKDEKCQIRHRVDGPSIEYSNYQNYQKQYQVNSDGRGRKSDSYVERVHCIKEFHNNGKYHREDGPAVEWSDGEKWWYKNGKCHREDGPAIERTNGSNQYFLNGKKYTEEQYLAMIRLGSFV